MITKIKLLFGALIVCGMVLSASSLSADDSLLVTDTVDPGEVPGFSATEIEYAQGVADGIIEEKRMIESCLAKQVGAITEDASSDSDGRKTYNADGTIDKVCYADGTSTQYSYKHDDDGKITKIMLHKGDTAIIITTTSMTRVSGDAIERSWNGPTEGNVTTNGTGTTTTGNADPPDETPHELLGGGSNGPIITLGKEPPIKFTPPKRKRRRDDDDTVFPDDHFDLDDIAHNGIPFDELNRLFDELQDAQEEARQRFYDNDTTEEYYDQLERAWADVNDPEGDSPRSLTRYALSSPMGSSRDLNDGDTKDNDLLNDLSAEVIAGNMEDFRLASEGERREALENLMEYLRTMVPRNEVEKALKAYMLDLEGELWAKIQPNIDTLKRDMVTASELFMKKLEPLLRGIIGARISSDGEKTEALVVLPAVGGDDGDSSEDTDTEEETE
jgi:hypothetical protein